MSFSKLFVLIFLAGIVLSSCKDQYDTSDEVVVRVYNDVMLRSDLAAKMPYGQSDADSTRLADQIIKNWINTKTVLNFAERNLSDSQKDFSKQLQEYRNSLVVYAYERELINQKLDTVISDREMRTYYEGNIENFKEKIKYRGWTTYCDVLVENCEKLSSFSEVVFNKLVAETLYSHLLSFF